MIETHSQEKIKLAMTEVDEAFKDSIVRSDVFPSLFEKICSNAFFIRVEFDSEICAYASMYANDKKSCEAYVSLIAVKQKFRKKRIGTEMMQKCFEHAKICGMQKVKLEVKKDNAAAISFYKKMGFSFFAECSPGSDYYITNL